MPTTLTSSTIFATPDALPRGPHSLTRDEVAASQRVRLMAAITQLLAERGYRAVTIGELARRAGVSRAAFYEHFADKEACLLAAYEEFRSAIIGAMTDGVGDDAPYESFIDTALMGYLRLLEREPVAARAFILEMDAAGAAARRVRRDAIHAFARLFEERHRATQTDTPAFNPLPYNAYLGIALGVRELIRESLEDDPEPRLTTLAPEINAWLEATVQGTGTP